MSISTSKNPSTEMRMCAVSEDVLFWAFRYTLGRMTYSVKDVTDTIIMNISNLTMSTARQMLKEIEQAAVRDGLGMDMDKEEWFKVRELLHKKINSGASK